MIKVGDNNSDALMMMKMTMIMMMKMTKIMLMAMTVFLPGHDIVALTQGVPRHKEGKNTYYKKYVNICTHTLTQTCENLELTLSKNCDPLFSLMTPL